MQVHQYAVVGGEVDLTQRTAQIALGFLVEDLQVEVYLSAQMLVDPGKVRLPPCGAERKDLHFPGSPHRRIALRVYDHLNSTRQSVRSASR
ncbi:hypothetical protein D3C80_1932050 [compost metagenome]